MIPCITPEQYLDMAIPEEIKENYDVDGNCVADNYSNIINMFNGCTADGQKEAQKKIPNMHILVINARDHNGAFKLNTLNAISTIAKTRNWGKTTHCRVQNCSEMETACQKQGKPLNSRRTYFLRGHGDEKRGIILSEKRYLSHEELSKQVRNGEVDSVICSSCSLGTPYLERKEEDSIITSFGKKFSLECPGVSVTVIEGKGFSTDVEQLYEDGNRKLKAHFLRGKAKEDWSRVFQAREEIDYQKAANVLRACNDLEKDQGNVAKQQYLKHLLNHTLISTRYLRRFYLKSLKNKNEPAIAAFREMSGFSYLFSFPARDKKKPEVIQQFHAEVNHAIENLNTEKGKHRLLSLLKHGSRFLDPICMQEIFDQHHKKNNTVACELLLRVNPFLADGNFKSRYKIMSDAVSYALSSPKGLEQLMNLSLLYRKSPCVLKVFATIFGKLINNVHSNEHQLDLRKVIEAIIDHIVTREEEEQEEFFDLLFKILLSPLQLENKKEYDAIKDYILNLDNPSLMEKFNSICGENFPLLFKSKLAFIENLILTKISCHLKGNHEKPSKAIIGDMFYKSLVGFVRAYSNEICRAIDWTDLHFDTEREFPDIMLRQ